VKGPDLPSALDAHLEARVRQLAGQIVHLRKPGLRLQRGRFVGRSQDAEQAAQLDERSPPDLLNAVEDLGG
jgi:hypothetical protein